MENENVCKKNIMDFYFSQEQLKDQATLAKNSGEKFIRNFINNREFTEMVKHDVKPTHEDSRFLLSLPDPSEGNPDALIVKLESDTDYVLISNS